MIPNCEDPDALFSSICGDQFDEGYHRTVHHVKGHNNLVMKVSKNTTFANWCEYLVSHALYGRSEQVAGLMGNVKSVSETGNYLIMERLENVNRPLRGTPYPCWLSDSKRSSFGLDAQGNIKVRDYGTLNLIGVLANRQTQFEENTYTKIVSDGEDHNFKALVGTKIGDDAGRTIHEVNGHPGFVIKVCNGSHKKNRIEFLVHWALQDMNACEYRVFGALECSRSGKYLIMERLSNLPATFSGKKPAFPSWLADNSDSCLGLTPNGIVKIRSYSSVKLGDVLANSPLRTHQ